MNVVLDLDGVVYRGETMIEGADQALRRAIDGGARLWFVTNNSTRTPAEVIAKLKRLTGLSFEEGQVVTSALAAASMLGPSDGPVLVLGMGAIASALDEVGLETTTDPKEAQAVVVGLDRDLTYERLAAAVEAVRAGARFIATNIDPTYPVENGFQPGSGSIVAAVATAAEASPEVAGKPHRPTRDLLADRGVTEAWVIGDRLDTDIALADDDNNWKSVLVLTGVSREDDDHAAADLVAEDLAAAMDLVLEERE